MKISPLNHAALHAASKQIEKMIDPKKGLENIPHGKVYDLSGMTVTITFPEGTTVSRDSGVDGDGKKERRATPMLYGRVIWGLLKAKLEKFNQWKTVECYIIQTLQEFLDRLAKGKAKGTLQEELAQLDEYDKEWETYLLNTFQDIPSLTCDTERKIFKEKEALVEVTSPVKGKGK